MEEKHLEQEIEEYRADDFSDIKIVGKGGHSNVYSAYSSKLGDVALKIYTEAVSKKEMQEVQLLLNTSKHPNIMRIYGIMVNEYKDEKCMGYVMDLMYSTLEKCGLSSFLKRDKNGTAYGIHNPSLSYNFVQAYSWIEQTAYALQYLHENKVLHRDIKPSNILVDESLKKIRLCDFGIARLASSDTITSGAGTFLYMAPENIESGKYDHSADIYSLTVTAVPFYPIKGGGVIAEVLNGKRPTIDANLDPELRDFIKKGWDQNPLQRPTLSHFIKLVRRKGLEHGSTSLIPVQGTSDLPAETTFVADVTVTCSSKTLTCQPTNQGYIVHKVGLSYKVIKRFLSRMSPVQIADFQKKLESLSADEKCIVLAPRHLAEKSQEQLKVWLKSKGDFSTSLEISVGEGDVLISTSDMFFHVREYFQVFPFGSLQLQAPNYRLHPLPSEKQLDQPKELRILMAGDPRLDLKSFRRNSVATYSRETLGRCNEAEPEETQIPLDGIMNSFFVVEDGEGTLRQRFSKTVQVLDELEIVCIFICMDWNKQLFDILTSVQIEKIIIVGVCEKIHSEQVLRKKLAKMYGEKAKKCHVLYLKKSDLFERTTAEHFEATSKVIEACIDRARRCFYCYR